MDSGTGGTGSFNLEDMKSNNHLFHRQMKNIAQIVNDGKEKTWGWRLEVRGIPEIAEAMTNHIIQTFAAYTRNIDKFTVAVESELICKTMMALVLAIANVVDLAYEKMKR
ncbi:hypothetical protein HK100_010629, partial [Physocladia obscura]